MTSAPDQTPPFGRRIVIFHDSEDFGGHERAFLMWLPALLASPRVASVVLCLAAANKAFAAALAPHVGSKLRLEPTRYHKLSLEPVKAPFRLSYRRFVRRLLAIERADLVLLLQGRIENAVVPLLATPRGIDLVSYIPMAHSAAEMGRGGPAGVVMDALKRHYYRRPNRFLVPSRAVEAQLRRAGATGTIVVVPNVAYPPLEKLSRDEARLRLRISPDARIATFMGRFDAVQKGLDSLVAAIERDAERLSGWTFVFVGRGPDASLLKGFADRHRSPALHIVDWVERPSEHLCAADVVLMPSRFEGVPLLMLECIALGTPLLASNIDIFQEVLPEANRFDIASVPLSAALDRATTAQARRAFEALAEGAGAEARLAISQAAFVDGLLGHTAPIAGWEPGR